MGCDDSWLATMPSVVLSYSRADSNLIGSAALRCDVYIIQCSPEVINEESAFQVAIRSTAPLGFGAKFRPGYAHLDFHMRWFPCVLLHGYGYQRHCIQFIGESDSEIPKMAKPYFQSQI